MNKQNPQIIVVTTAYHMFRALILAKRQDIKCVGFGAKTKWYFTLNAFIREFVGYLSLTWKKHIIMIGINVCIVIAVYGFMPLLPYIAPLQSSFLFQRKR